MKILNFTVHPWFITTSVQTPRRWEEEEGVLRYTTIFFPKAERFSSQSVKELYNGVTYAILEKRIK